MVMATTRVSCAAASLRIIEQLVGTRAVGAWKPAALDAELRKASLPVSPACKLEAHATPTVQQVRRKYHMLFYRLFVCFFIVYV